MGFLSHRVERSDLVAGDHIYTWRAVYIYSHHGIYVGENKVVHFTQGQNLSSSGQSSFTGFSSSVSNVPAACLYFPDCCVKHTSGVITSCLNCFLGDGLLHCFQYGVSRLSFMAKLRGGTCTTAKSDPSEAVIHRAMYLLQNGFGKYDLFTKNCEDFALYCKTGRLVLRGNGQASSVSGQASSVLGVPVAAILSLPFRLFISNPVVLGTTTTVNYFVSRYASDIGVRHDVIKLEVEDIRVFHGNQHGDRDACPDVVDVNYTSSKAAETLLMENHHFVNHT